MIQAKVKLIRYIEGLEMCDLGKYKLLSGVKLFIVQLNLYPCILHCESYIRLFSVRFCIILSLVCI